MNYYGNTTVVLPPKRKEEKRNNEQKKILLEHFEKIWDIYPRKKGGGKAKSQAYFLNWIKGRKVNGETIKLTDKQMYLAVKKYAEECKDTEENFIKLGSTFFNNAILDYVENTSE